MAAELGITCIGVTILMVSGEFDLSVGSTYAISAFIFVKLASMGVPSLLVFSLTLAFAALIGFANGIITTKTRVPSFITTLGTMMFIRGLIYIATGGATASYQGDLMVPALLSLRLSQDGFLSYLRPSHFWYLAFIILFTILLFRTRYGNHVIATGGDPRTARSMGVEIERVKIINFIICSIMAGLAGIVVASRFLFVSPTIGEGRELEAIAAVVIGGTSLYGGYGTIIGSLLGVLLTAMISSGLLMIGAPPYWYSAFVGVILLLATIINIKMRK